MVADREYHKALLALAAKHDKGLGVLVRAALDEKYGAELEEIILFFREGDAKINQLMQNKITKRGKKAVKP